MVCLRGQISAEEMRKGRHGVGGEGEDSTRHDEGDVGVCEGEGRGED